MKKSLFTLFAGCLIGAGHMAQATSVADTLKKTRDTTVAPTKTPFDGYDLGWINGQNRNQNPSLLGLKDKDGETILTGSVLVDGYFNYNFARPKDNTQTNSSSTGRSNEFQLNQVSIGIESNYKNIIGRVWLQTGSMTSIVQEMDGSVARGRNTSTGNLKFIREAAAGYHFNVNYGLNVEMGIFQSYIGLESYVLQENWSYQRSMICELTPFYFQGVRLQYYPTRNFKTELWLLDGWQSYNSWSKNIGVGSSNYYRPTETTQLVYNFYYGNDSKSGTTELSKVHRIHNEASISQRYYKNKESKGLSQAAFNLDAHYGFQTGQGVKASQNYMTGFSLANRLWFMKNKLGWTMRGDYITNPGNGMPGYLAFYPAAIGQIPNDYDNAIASGKNLKITQLSTTFDVMPSDFVTFRLEYDFRKSNIPYFAGPGGTTSPTGFSTDPITPDWKPDLRKTENRIILSVSFRL
jgi:hypothetical protein